MPHEKKTPVLDVREYRDSDRDAVWALWQASGVTVDSAHAARDLQFCRASADNALFVGLQDARISATIMAGLDGHRGWFHYVAVDPDRHGSGLGRRMVAHAETWLARRGAVKVELMIRESNQAVQRFYESLGYGPEPRVVMSRDLVP
jgi:ribosomal protein S18 acetylase RimI-like enzyme